ncbi:hypothetical protein FA15DRAFT_667731 [Coprinopsis marcescibilis]|uniref:RING-type domain-containing protein n=1 Tax=Coprinopsis marcescibilis TaxID=230819 RepID=A0A5C3L131_COPMA|nr:hypothetical protein FA15DRAFT_667731 [Coprinopsis marcescibilis]
MESTDTRQDDVEMRMSLDDLEEQSPLEGLYDNMSVNPGSIAREIERVVILLHGQNCGCNPRTSPPIGYRKKCLALAMKTASEMVEAAERHAEKKLSFGRNWSRMKNADELVKEMLSHDTLQACDVLEEIWTRPTNNVLALVNVEPFKSRFPTVIPSTHRVSYNGLLEFFHDMWAKASDPFIVAGVLQYREETILCLRLQLNLIPSTYMVFDFHPRSKEMRQPACVILASKENAAEYITALFTSEGGGDSRELSALILHQGSGASPKFTTSPMRPQPPPPLFGDFPATPPAYPTPPNSASKVTPKDKEDKPRKRITAPNPVTSPKKNPSKARVQSEFGWQMALQNQRLTFSTPPDLHKVEEPPGAPMIHIESVDDDGSDDPPIIQHKGITDARSSAKSVVYAQGFVASDSSKAKELASKDIGWQLALQNITMGQTESNISIDQDEFLPPNPAFLGHRRGSSDNILLNSGKAERTLLSQTHSSQTLRSDAQRQKPVRDDFSWQLGLAAKSLTLPLTRTTSNILGGSDSVKRSDFGELFVSGSSALATGSSLEQGKGARPGIVTAKQEKSTSRMRITIDEGHAREMCSQCLDFFSTDNLVVMGGCGHCFCVPCARRLILDKLELATFPITCAACIRFGNIFPGQVSVELLYMVNLPEREADKFRRFQLASTTINVRCKGCKTEGPISRERWYYGKIQRCHNMECEYTWCKACHEELKPMSKHECKNYKIDALLKRNGWRRCPGCQTSIQRPRNPSNHIVCPTPGCLFHFCYKCGDIIADEMTVSPGVLAEAVTLHYRRCSPEAKCVIQ